MRTLIHNEDGTTLILEGQWSVVGHSEAASPASATLSLEGPGGSPIASGGWPYSVSAEHLRSIGVAARDAEAYCPSPRPLSLEALEVCFQSTGGRNELSLLAQVVSNGHAVSDGRSFERVISELNRSVDGGRCAAGDAARIAHHLIHNNPGAFRTAA